MTISEREIRFKALMEASDYARNWFEDYYKKKIDKNEDYDTSWYRGMEMAYDSIANQLMIKAYEEYITNDRI